MQSQKIKSYGLVAVLSGIILAFVASWAVIIYNSDIDIPADPNAVQWLAQIETDNDDAPEIIVQDEETDWIEFELTDEYYYRTY